MPCAETTYLSSALIKMTKHMGFPHHPWQKNNVASYPKAKRDLAIKPEKVEAGFPMNTSAISAAVMSDPIQLVSGGIK